MSVLGRMGDYHTHTSRCGHAVGRPVEYIEAARARGLGALGVSDHLPLVGHPEPAMGMAPSELDEYVAEVQELKAAFPGYVLLGIEADFIPGLLGELRDVLSAHPFDYVIGSVHYLEEWGFDSPDQMEEWSRRKIDDVYREYFGLLGELVGSGLFTILGHLDLVKKFGHRPLIPVEELVGALVSRLASSGMIVEINTAGLRRPVGEMYPEPALLAALKRSGVPITFGSDAHAPAEVGLGFEEAVRAARSAGYSSFVRLDAREEGRRARVRFETL